MGLEDLIHIQRLIPITHVCIATRGGNYVCFGISRLRENADRLNAAPRINRVPTVDVEVISYELPTAFARIRLNSPFSRDARVIADDVLTVESRPHRSKDLSF